MKILVSALPHLSSPATTARRASLSSLSRALSQPPSSAAQSRSSSTASISSSSSSNASSSSLQNLPPTPSAHRPLPHAPPKVSPWPKGTWDDPVPITSTTDERVLACTGLSLATPGSSHPTTWLTIRKDRLSQCPDCGQVYKLVQADHQSEHHDDQRQRHSHRHPDGNKRNNIFQ